MSAGPTRQSERLIQLEPRRTATDPAALAEAIDRLGATLDLRFAQLDRQVASLLTRASPVIEGLPAEPVRATDRPVVIRCLGPFQCNIDGAPIESWRSSKARSLLQYLINHRGRPVPRDTLIQALWPDPDAVAAGTSLKVAVHALRQSLQQVAGAQTRLTVLAHECGYQLNAAPVWIDVEEFDRYYARGRALDGHGQPTRALDFYTRAADLYRGDFLEETSDDWPMFRREALKDQYLFVLTRLAKAAAAAGDYQGAIVRCQQLLAKDRCREDAYRLIMICHARLGQRGRARTWYDLCVQTLRTELDCGPEPETERIYRLARAGQT